MCSIIRASYAEETDAVVRYLVNVRRLRPEQIVVFAQQDAFGDAGFEGVAKAVRALRSGRETEVLRLNYKRNTIDVDEAVAQLRKLRTPPRAVVMVATYRAAAKFIEKTRRYQPAADLHQRLLRGQHRARRGAHAAGSQICERRDRDAGRAGGRQLFKRRAGIQDGALPLLSRRGARLRVARGLHHRQCA